VVGGLKYHRFFDDRHGPWTSIHLAGLETANQYVIGFGLVFRVMCGKTFG
jgi:hypothetical protein